TRIRFAGRDNRRAQRHRRVFCRHRKCAARCLRRGKSVSGFAAAMSMRVPVSVIVPIINEAANLPRCLDCVKWADEIFVIDSESTDDSIAIALQHGAQVVQFEFNGIWPKKKNWALENVRFRNDWVFVLDADEVLPPQAEAEFAKAIAEAGDIAGYWINRRFMFMGRWMQHAYYPNWNLRLFRHALGHYEKLTDAATDSGDNEVHQHLPFRPLLRFLYVYVWQKGFLDGMEGYYCARLHGFYEFLSVAKTRELQRRESSATDAGQ